LVGEKRKLLCGQKDLQRESQKKDAGYACEKKRNLPWNLAVFEFNAY
jgi:hypothetical protein